MKITTLELANVKRIKALRLVPTEKGLTIIGGKNGQGKTSVLDAIAYGFGGERYKPSNFKREGAIGDSIIHIETDDGFIIERKGKNAALTVTDKEGKRGGQAILNTLLSDLAIDLPKFHNASPKDKANMLLAHLGIAEKLADFDRQIKAKYDTRTTIGREADQKEKAAKDMPWYENAPTEPLSVSQLIKEQQETLMRNGERDKARNELARNKDMLLHQEAEAKRLTDELNATLENIKLTRKAITDAAEITPNESTAELEKQIHEFEEINAKVVANAERTRRENEADVLHDQCNKLTVEIEDLRKQRLALLNGVKFPLDGLTVSNGELTYDGKAWDCMSGSQQLIVDCAIASRLNPNCRFILLDKLEQLDLDTLNEFGEWLEKQDLQCIATRVSTGDECTLIIEDGESTTPEGSIIIPAKKSLPEEY